MYDEDVNENLNDAGFEDSASPVLKNAAAPAPKKEQVQDGITSAVVGVDGSTESKNTSEESNTSKVSRVSFLRESGGEVDHFEGDDVKREK